MDIFNNLKVSYQVESVNKKGTFTTYTFLVDGERILFENQNFSSLCRNEQLQIVIKFINIDRLRYKAKEYVNISFCEEIGNRQNNLHTYTITNS
ncbi:MAG: hypothetical protein ACI9Y7_000092 [Dokdonia sp.]|jgi:hypothetical protein